MSEVPLPPGNLRKCGSEYRKDAHYRRTGVEEARRLHAYAEGLSPRTRLLDLGCGAGRLAIGLKNSDYLGDYVGFDLDEKAIRWCRDNLAGDRYRFDHADLRHGRYNKDGVLVMDEDFRLPYADRAFDVIYLYSLFTHLVRHEVLIYLKEFERLLAGPRAFVFLTAFVEPVDEDMAINPPHYPPHYRNRHMGPLHRVRYSRECFDQMVETAGLRIERFDHQKEWNCQSGIYLRRS